MHNVVARRKLRLYMLGLSSWVRHVSCVCHEGTRVRMEKRVVSLKGRELVYLVKRVIIINDSRHNTVNVDCCYRANVALSVLV